MTTLLLKKSALITRAQSIALKGSRSQWSKGVSLFAAEIIEDCPEWAEALHVDLSASQLEAALLRNATDWGQYYSGACGRHIETAVLADILAPVSARAHLISMDAETLIKEVGRAYSQAARAVKTAYVDLVNSLSDGSPEMSIYCLMNDENTPDIGLWRVCTHVTKRGSCFDHFAAFRVADDCTVNCSADLAQATGISTDRRGNLLIRSFYSESLFMADKLKAAVEASPFIFEGGKLPKIRLIW